LNGAILGMRKTEIDRKFDEMVAFAGVERFIDTPVKRYSSGMYLRLAFSVAAHLEPEILIVDEVLAVGDAAFQKKCLSKMRSIAHGGRTVFFVSHNMPAVESLCHRAILLDEGRVLQDGPATEVVGSYLRSGLGTTAAREWNDPRDRPGDDVVSLLAVRARSEDGQICDIFDSRDAVQMEMEFEVTKAGYVLMPRFHLQNENGVTAFTAHDLDPEWRRRRRPAGRYISTARIPGNLLAEGTLFVTASMLALMPERRPFKERDAIAFRVVDRPEAGARRNLIGQVHGVVRPLLNWTTTYLGPGDAAARGERAG
jgi:lipopolysaccharide transport system ATP-binding protein